MTFVFLVLRRRRGFGLSSPLEGIRGPFPQVPILYLGGLLIGTSEKPAMKFSISPKDGTEMLREFE